MGLNTAKFRCSLRQTLFFILALLFLSCSKKQESEQLKYTNPVSNTDAKPIYDSLSTKKCQHFNLSEEFDIKVDFERYVNTKNYDDSCFVNLSVMDKETKKVMDKILISSRFYYDVIFSDCKNVLSYSTKINLGKEGADNYYGDIIVADLNFDNKDDIVVINDSGSNGGAFYSYYMQNPGKKFVLNKFLTDSVTFFPTKINSKNKTLATYVPGGVCGLGEDIYKLNPKSNTWTRKSHRIINICEQ